MNEQFVSIFNKTQESSSNNDEEYLISDPSKLNEVIIDCFEETIDSFTFKLYLLKFSDHTFIDCDENGNLIKNEIPLLYQVSLSVTLTDKNIYTINNALITKIGSLDKAKEEFTSIKNVIDNNTLEDLLNKFIFNL